MRRKLAVASACSLLTSLAVAIPAAPAFACTNDPLLPGSVDGKEMRYVNGGTIPETSAAISPEISRGWLDVKEGSAR